MSIKIAKNEASHFVVIDSLLTFRCNISLVLPLSWRGITNKIVSGSLLHGAKATQKLQ